MADAPRPFDRRDWMRDLLSEDRDQALARELIRRGALTPSERDEAVRRQAEGGEPRPSLEDVLRGSVDPAALKEALRAVAAEEFSRLGSAQGLALPAEAAEAAGDPAKGLGDYILVAPLGRGGAGEVWKAWDRRLSRWVALKIANGPAPSKDAWERFRRESLAAGRLSHPGIVPVHDEGQAGGRPYIVMQYVEGETLDRRRLSLRESLEAAWTVATALHHAHERKVVHRDVKPGNILLDRRGAAWILDFGIALLSEVDGRLTTAGAVLGTPAYMSPEQARGSRATDDPAVDVYGLGATLYDLVTGQPPFAGGSFAETIGKVTREEPVPPRKLNRQLPRDVETVILKAMDKDPRRRYASAAALAEDLRRVLDGEPILARPAGLPYRLRRFVRRHRLSSALGATALAAVVAAAVLGARAVERSAAMETAARERERADFERRLALELLRETSRVSLDAALALRREGANDRMRPFLESLEAAYRQAAERAPDLAEVDYRMGRMHRALMDDATALQFQERALRKQPGYAPARYERAVLLAKKFAGNLKKAVEEPPAAERTPDAYTEALRTIREDCAALEKALAGGAEVPMSPANLTAARGILAYYQERIDEALRLLNEAVGADPLMEEAWETLAQAVLLRPGAPSALGRRDAIAVYTRGLRHDRGYVPLWMGRGRTSMAFVYDGIERGENPAAELEAAEGDFLEAVRLSPRDAEAWLAIADLRSNQAFLRRARGGDPRTLFEEAERGFDQALDLDPAMAPAWRGRGILRTYWARHLAEKGGIALPRWSEAVDDQSRYVALSESAEPWRLADARMRRATALMERGLASDPPSSQDLAAAEEDFALALELDGGQARIWSRRGDARRRRAEAAEARGEDPLADLRAAEDDLSKAVELSPPLAEAWLGRGIVRSRRARILRYGSEDAERAARDLTRALELNKGAVEAWTERASLRLGLAEAGGTGAASFYEMAAADIAQAIALNPSLSDGLHRKLASLREKMRGTER